MNKAMPWNINGVGFDAREAARESARRQGKSLGEWLHGVIADHAEDHGLAARDIGGQDRIEAVTSRLEQMGARPADHGRRPVRAKAAETRARMIRRAPDDMSFGEDAPARRRDADDEREMRRSRAFVPDETDDLLEDAIGAMERRAVRSERRTDQALASVAKLLETNEARRAQEHEAVAAMARKLGDLESRLTERFDAGDDNPIKGSLARLEARLDAIGRRGAAETAARERVTVAAVPEKAADVPEPLRRLEDKLNSILEAVQLRPAPVAAVPETSVAAMTAARAAETGTRRSLGEAISEIARRQRALDNPAEAETRLPQRAALPIARAATHANEGATSALRLQIAGLAAKIEDMRQEALVGGQARVQAKAPTVELDGLRAELAAMSRTLGDLAPRGSVDALEASIAALGQRFETSRDEGIRDSVLRPVEAAMGDLRRSLASLDPHEAIGGVQRELRSVAGKVDGLAGLDGAALDRLQRQMEDLREMMVASAARPLGVERIERQVAVLADRMDQRLEQHLDRRVEAPANDIGQELGAAADALRSMLANPPRPASLDKIESRLESLSGRLDQALTSPPQRAAPAPDTLALEQLVRDLAVKFDAARAPDSEGQAMEALQRQVEHLSARFERSETGLAALPTLAASVRDLFDHLETTRASVDASAAKAAREVLRIAADEGRHHHEASVATDVATLRDLQAEAETRSRSTLNTVHEMLEKVVDRMSTMERDLTEVKSRPETLPVAAVPVAPHDPDGLRSATSALRPRVAAVRPTVGEPRDFRLGGVEPRLDHPPKQSRKPEPPAVERRKAVESETEDRRGDFIAAARRAAATAQAETAAAVRRSAGGAIARESLMARSRDYVATHKRPVLMGLAAIMMVLGAIALMGRMGEEGADRNLAAAPAPRIAVASAAPTPKPEVATAADSMSPSALPKTSGSLANPIPGSDPIQTGSIPSLPSFAAGMAPAPQRPQLPRGLVAAAEAGDTSAQYDLANRVAEGRTVPRDMKASAKWFEKAADAGLAPAQYRLASLYEKGIGVAPDKAKAKGLYLKSAEAGNPRAMHNLAVMLADGDGHPDYAAAVEWFRKAAQYGVHDSQYNLAVLLARGLGTSQSLVQSYQWFTIAAAAGDADAGKKRDEVALKLGANDLAVAKALAAAFHPKVADPAAVDVQPPPGGWDGAPAASHLNSARSKISSL